MKHRNGLPLLLLVFSAMTSAFSISAIIKQAEVIKVNAFQSATAQAIKVTTTIRGFAANDPFQIKTLDIPKTTYMTRLKAGMGESGGFKGLLKRNAWYAAWFATMAAAGWAIDELTNEVTKPVKVTKYTGQVGQFNNPSYLGGNLTLPEAVAKVIGECSSSGYSNCASDSALTMVTAPSTYSFKVTYKFNGNSYSRNVYYYVTSTTEEITSTQPVPDDAIYDSLVSSMMADPQAAAQAFMVPDPYPYPYPEILPSQVPYIPGVAESDQEALDWYYKGLLQSTNPNAPYYVSPERYQQIAALANQLQQATNPQTQADALNNNMKNPLTQKELEETLKKRDTEAKKEADDISKTDTKPVTDAYKDSKLKDEYDKLKERVSDPSKMPQLPPLPAQEQIDLPTFKQCQTITVNFFNGALTFPNPDQCKKLEQVKTGLGYLMYVLTALGLIMELFRRVE
ncbi:hypothetical protein JD501_01760 [Aeromonas hydrophila]|uniref:hypothetical protein n=1 Tax=Aeromonas hydrophila TaxID=644 RepID=UPI00191E849E|nr:hypothetical protein [Aeromonas hydrophila]MBL0431948.1 hypothetical protein [Aeromonas hydrophila]MBL0431958.1 hypothetical protein [Aeromonas hydrophila]MBL0467919.1 hypothetical protein [Aeromonas hydrophila]MBL0467929.1 hypothetical protein [Aeromonas hydrophila]